MRSYQAAVTSKGQVTVPREIRRLKNIRPLSRVMFKVKNEEVTIEKAPSMKDLAGSLYNPKIKPLSIDQLRKIRESGEIIESNV